MPRKLSLNDVEHLPSTVAHQCDSLLTTYDPRVFKREIKRLSHWLQRAEERQERITDKRQLKVLRGNIAVVKRVLASTDNRIKSIAEDIEELLAMRQTNMYVSIE